MIPAGHPKESASSEEAPKASAEEKAKLVDAINECFELLRINYQHLYFSAYPEVDAVNAAKRLWLEGLSNFSADTIRQATHELIKQSDYLPTISRMIRKATELSGSTELPSAHSAYVEACNASSPKQNHPWSHPAVYYAGKQSDWFFLAHNSENRTFPIFKANYERLCEKILCGEALPPIKQLALPEHSETPLSKEENSERMTELRSELGI